MFTGRTLLDRIGIPPTGGYRVWEGRKLGSHALDGCDGEKSGQCARRTHNPVDRAINKPHPSQLELLQNHFLAHLFEVIDFTVLRKNSSKLLQNNEENKVVR